MPAAVVTEIGPLVAPAGTRALMNDEPIVLKDAAVPLNRTAVAPVKPVPRTKTDVPVVPDVGLKLVTDRVTVKFDALVAVPEGVVTVTRPVDAPSGTVAVICVDEPTANVATRPLNRTAVAPVKFDPLTATVVPVGPEPGARLEIEGAVPPPPPPPPPPLTVKAPALVVVVGDVNRVTVIGPDVALDGTVARN